MSKTARLWLLLVVILLAAIVALPVMAQDSSVSDDQVNEVARDIYCPVCENTPLDVCQTQACADWRELIRTKLAAGDSKEDVFEYFARQYGDGVLANPPSRGVSLVVLWVLPVVVILFGLLFFVRYMQRLRSAAPQAAAPAPTTPVAAPSKPAPDDYLARIEEELNKRHE